MFIRKRGDDQSKSMSLFLLISVFLVCIYIFFFCLGMTYTTLFHFFLISASAYQVIFFPHKFRKAGAKKFSREQNLNHNSADDSKREPTHRAAVVCRTFVRCVVPLLLDFGRQPPLFKNASRFSATIDSILSFRTATANA